MDILHGHELHMYSSEFSMACAGFVERYAGACKSLLEIPEIHCHCLGYLVGRIKIPPVASWNDRGSMAAPISSTSSLVLPEFRVSFLAIVSAFLASASDRWTHVQLYVQLVRCLGRRRRLIQYGQKSLFILPLFAAPCLVATKFLLSFNLCHQTLRLCFMRHCPLFVLPLSTSLVVLSDARTPLNVISFF